MYIYNILYYITKKNIILKKKLLIHYLRYNAIQYSLRSIHFIQIKTEN